MEAKLLQGINKWTGRNERDKIRNQESVVTLQKRLVTVGYTTITCVTYARKFDPLRGEENEENDEINDNWGFLQAEDLQDTCWNGRELWKCWKVLSEDDLSNDQLTVIIMMIFTYFYTFNVLLTVHHDRSVQQEPTGCTIYVLSIYFSN
jgi:hypothetical protein